MMPKLAIVTFGCQANELDSQRIAGVMAREGYSLTEDIAQADLIILNGCSIREKAEQNLYSRLGTFQELKARNPQLRLGVTGCLGQREGEALLRRFPYLDLVAGTGQIPQLPRLLALREATGVCGPPPAPTDLFPDAVELVRDSPIKAWVSVMDGCDNFCAFCVVPFTRGRERSRPPEAIVAEVAGLCARGYREVTLLGQTVNSYGKKLDPPTTFAALLRRVDAAAAPALRVRFTTSFPPDVTPELAEAVGTLPSVCEHVHLPVQSGSSRTLERMGRGYTREDYLGKVALLRAAVPDLALSTDLIVGFPGETDADFAGTLSLLEAVRYDSLFAFKFSPRPQTAAASMPGQVPEPVQAARLARLQALQAAIALERNRAWIGREVEVLVDSDEVKRATPLAAGRTRQNKVVHFPAPPGISEGEIRRVRITDASPYHLKGDAIGSVPCA
jgi:tRNA-2-methylthio-N6-dimethylallyladenosine synthase